MSGVSRDTINRLSAKTASQAFEETHTAKVRDGLNDTRRIIENLVAKRDSRRDGFVEWKVLAEVG